MAAKKTNKKSAKKKTKSEKKTVAKTAKQKDPTEPIRLKASRYSEVDEGTACTQSSFKTGKKGFLFIGMQGGRYKAMFKLQKSIPEACKLAAKDPDCFQVGSTSWVTARFTAEKPLPGKLWEKWLDESFNLSRPSGAKVNVATWKKAASKKTAVKKTAVKKTAVKKTAKKKTTKKKTVAVSKASKKTAKQKAVTGKLKAKRS